MSVAPTSTQKLIIKFPTDKQWIKAVPGEQAAICVRGSDVSDAYSVVELMVAPLGGPPMHIHENEDEIIVVLEGCVRCVCDETRFDAPAGTTFVVPRGVPHAWRSLPDTTSRVLLTFTPSGMEGYFEEVAGRPQEEWATIAKKYACLLVGPRIEL
ncbi:cupin domain-containing protein [Acidicapsa ligni]|uniref:cupin domain-containing protein n=1 Tax=Acidicapsa ligni TaxID=542300 RepID=UPI0021DFE747|nr:cupin domain-containing protein [Acidicapsa ligni]